jgi:TPR repeat protein
MANKYDYTMAYYDVFDCLTLLYWDDCDNTSCWLDSLDNQTRMMALEYLKKAADKGERNASWELGRLYIEGKHVQKDTVLGNQLLAVP